MHTLLPPFSGSRPDPTAYTELLNRRHDQHFLDPWSDSFLIPPKAERANADSCAGSEEPPMPRVEEYCILVKYAVHQAPKRGVYHL